MRKRREYTPEYKASLVLEALQEDLTMSQIASREGINLKQLSNWKKEFVQNAARAFSQSRDERTMAAKMAEMKENERDYQAKVGQLTLEVDFLKKKHEQIHGYGWEAKVGYKG